MLQLIMAYMQDRLAKGEEGQTMVEYALILALVSIAAIATLGPLGDAIAALFDTVTGEL